MSVQFGFSPAPHHHPAGEVVPEVGQPPQQPVPTEPAPSLQHDQLVPAREAAAAAAAPEVPDAREHLQGAALRRAFQSAAGRLAGEQTVDAALGSDGSPAPAAEPAGERTSAEHTEPAAGQPPIEPAEEAPAAPGGPPTIDPPHQPPVPGAQPPEESGEGDGQPPAEGDTQPPAEAAAPADETPGRLNLDPETRAAKEADEEYREAIVSNVTSYDDGSYEIETDLTDGQGHVVGSAYYTYTPREGVAPQAGEIARFYGQANDVRGLDVGGREEDYTPPAQQAAEAAADSFTVREGHRQRELEYDLRAEMLPPVLREQIEHLRATMRDFRETREEMALSVAEAAADLARAFPSPEAIELFRSLSPDEQTAVLPESIQGNPHYSPNVLDDMCDLADLVLRHRDTEQGNDEQA